MGKTKDNRKSLIDKILFPQPETNNGIKRTFAKTTTRYG